MPNFSANSYHDARDHINDVKAALAAMTLMFDETIDMGEIHKRGAKVISDSLCDVLEVAGAKAERDSEIRYAHEKLEDDMKRRIEIARTEAYAKGREDGAKANMESIERLARAVQPIMERAAAVSEHDGVYPHIGTPAPDIGAPSARCA